MFDRITSLDEKILMNISKLKRPYLDKTMVFFTKIGNTGIVWVLTSFFLYLSPHHRRNALKIIVSLFLTGFLGEIIIKTLVGRIRPSKSISQEKLLIKKPRTYSFPSGHTSSSFATALIISLAYPYFSLLAFILAFLIAFSRLYLRVHYPSDVLAGALLGLICSMAVNYFMWI